MKAIDSMAWLQELVKAELHVHLEGSLSVESLNKIARRKGLPLIVENPYIFHDFQEFNQCFLFLADFLTEEEDFFQLAFDFTSRQARRKINYTEASFMPMGHIRRGVAMA